VTQFLLCGTFATHVVVHAAQAVRVADELPLEHACLLACSVATGVGSVFNTARVWRDARAAVIGCGGVGISVVQGARLAGATEIVAVDLDARKREAAIGFGATHAAASLEQDVDFVFDVVGRPETLRAAADALARGGTAVLVGIPPPGVRVELDLRRLFEARARVLVSHGGDYLPDVDIPLLAERALAGELDLAGMVTRQIGLDDVPDALDELPRWDGIRSVVRFETPE
jgi:Zn-dependent alcohol dehydrogenase